MCGWFGSCRREVVVQRRGDGGAAPVEFVLVGTLVTALFLGLVELGLVLYVRNMATAEASEGARYAASFGVGCSSAIPHITERLQRVVPAAIRNVSCDPPAEGDDRVAVAVRVAVPGVGWLPGAEMVVVGHALNEGNS